MLGLGVLLFHSLDQILRDCTVRLSTSAGVVGTGFFVGRGLVLTCAHVVRGTAGRAAGVTAEWADKSIMLAPEELRLLPDPCPENNVFPDLALVRVPWDSHPCVWLDPGEVRLGDDLYTYGYPATRREGDSVTARCEGTTKFGQTAAHELLKFKAGQICPGISGSALLNLRTEGVCGVVKRTRDETSDLGGFAVRIPTLLDCFPDLVSAQELYHASDKTWTNLQRPASVEIGGEAAAVLGADASLKITVTSELAIFLGCCQVSPDSSKPKTDEALPSFTSKDIELQFSKSSNDLLRWPTTVSGDKWLERPELSILKENVSNTPNSVTMVLGPPGSGKSALLARLGQELVKEGSTVLAIKADQLDRTIDSSAKLADRLRLPLPTDSAVLAVAKDRPVVVLVDQLDALADLADLHSERLHVLLNLIQRISGRSRVHVICSCRNLEYQHDGRLSRLESTVIRLEPPSWEKVSELLTQRGIQPDVWPDDAKELLRVPYHLSLFLRRFKGPGEHVVFTTYQELINELWQHNVLDAGGGRFELLFDMANRMATDEQLWLDRTFYEDRWNTVSDLIGVDILRLSENGLQVSFRHQSLFEFIRAKAFSRDNSSLASYVLERQDAIFVRPTLWMTLNYLRNASPRTYRKEFERLWNEAAARHIRHLLIDFLSQVELPKPEDWEQGRMISALIDDSWRQKVLSAICNKKVWFDLFAPSYLPAEMQKTSEKAWDVIWVLVSSLSFAGQKCLGLMEQNWLPDESKLQHIWRTLDYLRDWDERSLKLTVAVVHRTAVEQGAMWNRAETMNNPKYAVQLLVSWLKCELNRIVSSESDDGKKGGRIVDIIDRHNQWHGLDDLVQKVPVEFIQGVWPVLSGIILSLDHSPSRCVIRYSDDHIVFSRVDRREYVAFDSPDQFFLAIDKAMREFARTHPKAFITVVRDTGNPDSRLLQRLMCRGVREVAASYPEFAMEFLLLDARRFWLGGMHDDIGDTIELIAAMAQELAPEKLVQLARSIQEWQMYWDHESQDYDRENEYARAFRFRLLEALPVELLSEDLRQAISSEREALPEYLRTAHSQCGTGLQAIGSPVSHSDMIGMSDSEIAEKFEELPDSTYTRHPNDCMVGGSIQLSQEFERFAEENPERALAVSSQFQPGAQERPAASLICALLKSKKRPMPEVIDLIEDLDRRGFSGRDYRVSVAFALSDFAASEGLLDRACQILERWRTADWATDEMEGDKETTPKDKNEPTSILWEDGGWISRPNGRYSVLEALTKGYLCRKLPAVDEWLDMLVDHLQRDDCLAEWSAMCRFLANVQCCSDKQKAWEFLDTLFARFPAVLSSRVGVLFLARVDSFLPEVSRMRAYAIVRGCNEEWGLQVFGELIGLRRLRYRGDAWAKDEVGKAVGNATESENEWIATGIAFAAAKMWREPLCREGASVLLAQLIPVASNRISRAAMSVWAVIDEAPSDMNTLSLLRQIAENPDVLKRATIDDTFFDHLLDQFNATTELVCRISEEAVRLRGAELQQARFGFYLAGSALIDISLRLQRNGGEFRRRGMEVFEKLLDLGVTDAIDIARSTDHRLASGTVPIRPLRRKRVSKGAEG